MKRWWAVAFVLISHGAGAELERKPWVELAVSQVFRPAMLNLSESTTRLSQGLSDTCDVSSSRNRFLDVVSDFSLIEYYRLGAMNQANRAERLFFWPDRKGTGQKQMRRLLANPDRAILDAESLAKKSVALQGLPALERVLFVETAEIGAADCAVARAIANNMENIAEQLRLDWVEDSGIAYSLQQPTENSVYRNYSESLSAVLTVAESALASMKDRKVKALTKGLTVQGRLPMSLPFMRSGQTFSNLRANLKSTQDLLIVSGIAASTGVESALVFEFQNAFNMIADVERSLAENNIDTAIERLTALSFILDSLKAIVTDSISDKMGVVTGFNSSDGD